jgi:hypothetical protein
MVKIIENYKGDAKAKALTVLFSRNVSSERSSLINFIEKSFSTDDPNTVISIIEKLKKMALSKNELEKISKNLCHYREEGSDDPNWKMIKYDMKKLEIDLAKICAY